MSNNDIMLSFVCPTYNEQDGLDTFYNRLKAVADSLNETYEIIFVNDGSKDGTAGVLDRLALQDRQVRVVEFSRNFGHQLALTAGYDVARGRAVISLDSDCQHPPEMIPELVARWREGYEVVYTVRTDTDGISPLKRAMVRMGYRAIRMASGVDLTDQADFRLLDRKAVEAIKSTREQARMLRGLVRWVGFKQISIPYKAQRRFAGKSVYALGQTLRMASAGIYNFSTKPLKLAGVLGGLFLAGAVAYVPLAVAAWLLWGGFSPWAHVTAALVAMFGLQFVMMGILGEYVGRVFEEVKDRPLYVVRRKLGFDTPAEEEIDDNLPGRSRFETHTFAVYT